MKRLTIITTGVVLLLTAMVGMAQERIDLNFKAVSEPSGKRTAAIPAADIRVVKGRLEVLIQYHETLETLTAMPPGPGPFPLAVVSHGTPTRGGRDAFKRTRLRPYLPVAVDFARRGYKAVIFARRGYASSTGEYAESYGRCHDANKWTLTQAAKEGAKDFAAVIETLTKQPDFDGTAVIAAGQSGGGFAASALAMDPPAKLAGIVNFSGGRGGAGKKGNCSETGFVGAFGNFGDGAKVPALWLYSTTDRLFKPDLVSRALAAYARNGASVRFEQVGKLWYSRNGHSLFRLGGRELWRPRIDDFLNAIGAPNWKLAPDDAAVAKPSAPQGLGRRCRRIWPAYLGRAGHKAFAQGEDEQRRCGWAALRDSVNEARNDAIRFCERGGGSCRIVAVGNKIVQR